MGRDRRDLRVQDSDLDLKYACRDAEEVHALVCTPEGGNFPAGRTRLLVDDGATTRALTQALRGFLMAAMPQDLVLLYFACHGGPDPRRPAGPLYLYTHDTDPADVAGTGLPMDDIDRSLRQVVRAERAVIVVDTCHSGGVGGGIRAAGRAEATNRYLEALAELEVASRCLPRRRRARPPKRTPAGAAAMACSPTTCWRACAARRTAIGEPGRHRLAGGTVRVRARPGSKRDRRAAAPGHRHHRIRPRPAHGGHRRTGRRAAPQSWARPV